MRRKRWVSIQDLFIQIQGLEDLFVALRLVHFKVREEFAATSNHGQKTAAGGVILLMVFQMLRNMVDLLGENTDLNLRRTSVFRMSLELPDDLLLIGFLESHGSGGEKRRKGTSETILRASRKALKG